MTIEEKREQGKLTLKIGGRLDTTTTPQLEKALDGSLSDITELVMDVTSLDYISSVGLRTLLATHKAMTGQGGRMIVRGANEEIRECFVITGFSQFLNLE